jgi:hypothetical protein
MNFNEISREKFKQLSKEEQEKIIKKTEQRAKWRRNHINKKLRIAKGRAGLIERIKEVHQRMKVEKTVEN